MAGYIENNLLKDERIVYQAKLHWIVFVSWRGLFTLFILPLIERISSEFAITNRRVIMKVGLVARRTLEMNLSKIESVNVDQGIFARLLGYGTVTVIGTGGTKETFAHISDPTEFRRQFQQTTP